MVEFRVKVLEFLSDAFDVRIHGAVVDLDLLTIRHVDQLVPVADVAGPFGQGLDQQVFRNGEADGLVLPGA